MAGEATGIGDPSWERGALTEPFLRGPGCWNDTRFKGNSQFRPYPGTEPAKAQLSKITLARKGEEACEFVREQ
jgi:hypothetical protein